MGAHSAAGAMVKLQEETPKLGISSAYIPARYNAQLHRECQHDIPAFPLLDCAKVK